MANSPRYHVTQRNAFLDAIDTALGSGGLLRVYSGTQPATVATALSTSHVLLAQLAMATTAFGVASSGVLTANAIADDSAADATGTAAWATLTTSTGGRRVDFSVGTSGADLNFNSVAFQSGAVVSVSALTITFPAT